MTREPRRRDRPGRLQWQSRALVTAVVPACLGAAAGFSIRSWGPATRNCLLVSLAFAFAARLARSATPPAAGAGGILTAAMVLMNVAGGNGQLRHSALLPLLTLFLLTFMATRFGRRSKKSLGVAEGRRGRGASQVVANLGVAALAGAAVLARTLLGHSTRTALSAVVLVAALAEATADTVSSELGEVLGGRPFLITTGKRVLPGTDGAVSVAGTIAGTLAAFAVVLVAVETIGLRAGGAVATAAGAFGGLFFDSLLGATLERGGWLNNDAVNFLSTLAAALLALTLSTSLG